MADPQPAPTRPLRIGVDAHVMDGKFQGSRTWLEQTLLRAIPRSQDVEWILYSRREASLGALAGLPNLRWRPIAVSGALARVGLFWPWVLARHDVDAVLFQYHGPPLFRRRQILVVHDILFETHPELFPPVMRLRLRMLVRHAVRGAAAVLTVSGWSRAQIIARYALNEGRVRLAPNGGPTALPSGPPRDGRTVLFVGRIERRKNLDLLLDAFARMATPGRRLVAVGRPEPGSEATLERLVQQPEVMVHHASLPQAELDALYASAAVLAYPSSAEGFGLPVLEALAHHLPVVASNAAAIPEAAGGFAALFDPSTPDAASRLAALLDEAIRKPPQHDPLALAAHLGRFSWDSAAEALLAALSEIPPRG